MNSMCVLSDSGTFAEESTMLSFPISIRTSTERPEVIDKGNMILGGITSKDIFQAINVQKNLKKYNHKVNQVLDYSDDMVSFKVLKIIQSYKR